MARGKMNLKGSRQKISMLTRHYIKNEIYLNDEITANLMRKTRLHLPNLTDFELHDDRAVFVTPVLVGEPLMEKKDLSSTEKVQIISSYLRIIKEFESLPISFQVNLIRPENFYIISGELKHRGVLIVEDIVFNRPLRMHHIRQGISNVMLDFIDNDLSLYNFKSYFRELPDQHQIDSYAQIEDDVKKIYIKDLFVEEDQPAYTEKVEEIQKAFFQRLRHVNFKFLVFMVLLSVFVITGIASLRGGIEVGKNTDIIPLFTIIDRNENLLIMDQSYVPPNMHISEKKWSIYKNNKLVREQSTDLVNLLLPEEGTYLISLELKDSKGNWSAPYEESYNKKYVFEDEDSLNNFSFIGADFDEEESYAGSKSLIFDSASKVKVNEIYLNGSILLEFMIKSPQEEKITLNLEGFYKGKKMMEQSAEIELEKDKWTEFILEFKSDELDEISLSFPTSEKDIWLDQLSLSSCIIPGFEF